MSSIKMTWTVCVCVCVCVCEVGTEIFYAIAMTVSPHRLKNYW